MTLQEENRRNLNIRRLMIQGLSRTEATRRYDETLAPKQQIERTRNGKMVAFYGSKELGNVTVPQA